MGPRGAPRALRGFSGLWLAHIDDGDRPEARERGGGSRGAGNGGSRIAASRMAGRGHGRNIAHRGANCSPLVAARTARQCCAAVPFNADAGRHPDRSRVGDPDGRHPATDRRVRPASPGRASALTVKAATKGLQFAPRCAMLPRRAGAADKKRDGRRMIEVGHVPPNTLCCGETCCNPNAEFCCGPNNDQCCSQ
jgi:hypothetical protein